MKLELKHLAGYLPYGLKIYDGEYSRIITFSHTTYSTIDVGIGRLFRPDYDFSMGLPILRPLSDIDSHKLLLEHFFNKEKNGVLKEIQMIGDLKYGPMECSYKVITMLISEHFDIYGLIEAKLAIDINTLEK